MLVVGIDLGTQSLKVVACDEHLVVRGSAAVAYPTSHPEPGRAEQDPRHWEAALGPAIAEALAAANAAPAEVAALAIAGQLDGCVAVDARGLPLHPALIWQDRRAVAQTVRATLASTFALTGQIPDASHMAPKIAWLREHGVAAVRFHQPVSYLVERLTGAAVIDPSLGSTTMLLELSSARWAPALLELYELEPEHLPEVRPTCAVAGGLTGEGARLCGLPPGTPVAVGTGDDFATPLGAGVVAPGAIVCAIGTAEVVGAVATTPVLDRAPEPMVETHVYPTGGYFVENPGWLSGGAVRWAVALLGLSHDAELDALAEAAPPGAGGVTFVPALAGAMTPVWRPHARGTLHGLAAGHTRADVARAVLEGLAFACRDVVDRLRGLGLPAERVLLLGGGARSRVWAQIRADVLGVPHDVAAVTEACPVGAAMIAAVAAGLYPDLASAAARIPPPAAIASPTAPGRLDVAPGRLDAAPGTLDAAPGMLDAAPGMLDAAYERYRRLVAQLAPLATAPWS